MERIGHYQIVSELGRGGMGVVYKAHEESLNRFVAIKVLGDHLVEDESYIQRFVREAQSAAKLNHPNIVQIYSINEDQGHHYFVMEYVSGTSLQKLIRTEGKLAVPQAARLILQTAGGLAAAHEQGVIHRDIKPANIMITDRGLVKIADFGLALMAEGASRLTATGMFMGTPGYLSPEQCLDRDIDHRTDIYSLGVTFFEAITGSQPFKATSPLALLRQIIEVEPPDVRELNPDVDEDVRTILTRMMAKDRDKRYAETSQVVDDLQSYLAGRGVPRHDLEQVTAGVSAGFVSPPEAAATVAADAAEEPLEATARMESGSATQVPTAPPSPAPATAPTPPAAPAPPSAAPPPPPSAPPAPKPAPSAPIDQPAAPAAAEPEAITPPPTTRRRTGVLVAVAVVVVGLLGLAAVGVAAWKLGYLGKIVPSMARSTASEDVLEDSADLAQAAGSEQAPTAAGELSEESDAATGVMAGKAAAEKGSSTNMAAPTNAGRQGSARSSGEETTSEPRQVATSRESAPSRGRTTAGQRSEPSSAKAGAAERPQPPALPPPGTVVVIGTGERLLAGEVESFLEGALGRAGFQVVDERGIPRVMDLVAGGDARPTELLGALRPNARRLLLVDAEYLGERQLRYMGRSEPAYSSRLTITPFDLVRGEALGPGFNEKVEYTRQNVQRVVEQTLRSHARDVARRLGRD